MVGWFSVATCLLSILFLSKETVPWTRGSSSAGGDMPAPRLAQAASQGVTSDSEARQLAFGSPRWVRSDDISDDLVSDRKQNISGQEEKAAPRLSSVYVTSRCRVSEVGLGLSSSQRGPGVEEDGKALRSKGCSPGEASMD